MANKKHVRILMQGVETWNAWRQRNPQITPDLTGMKLNEDERVVTDLSAVNLKEAELADADLGNADLMDADLTRAHLSGAILNLADLTSADLIQADLTGAELNTTNLSEANLTGANLSNCLLGYTLFVNVDLSQVRGLDTVRHEYPSSIGIDTIYRSGGNIPDVFLRGAGVPERFIEYMHSLVGQTLQFYSCFISFSHHDQSFCQRLRADLQARAVRVWYFPEDALGGRKVWGQIDRSIRIYDKLVVVCSEQSLQSGPVLREIERALQREDREGTDVLFPIRIDDYIFEHWQHERKADVIAKVVVDFTGWDKDVDRYNASLGKLVKALQPDVV